MDMDLLFLSMDMDGYGFDKPHPCQSLVEFERVKQSYDVVILTCLRPPGEKDDLSRTRIPATAPDLCE